MEHIDQKTEVISIFNKTLLKNISILTSLLFFGIVLIFIVNYYDKQSLQEGESTSASQILNSR